MKKIVLATVAALTGAMGFSAAAHAEAYGKVTAGGTFSGKYDVDGLGKADQDDMGWTAGAAVGKQLWPNVRADAEIARSEGELKGGADAKSTSILGNVYYDFAPGAKINPFVGAGIGGAKYEVGSVKDTAFTYQATAGVSAPLSDSVTGELAYRYTGAPDLKLNGAEADFGGSAITAGVRFKLGS